MAAAALVAISAGAYAWRWWLAREAEKQAPPVVPQAVQKRSETFSFSKVEGDRTLFTIRASQATEYKEGGKSLLEDVWITIYGRSGKRFDNIHTRECDYVPATGRVTCAGEVQIDLESQSEREARPGQRAIQIRTSGVSFERESGQAFTSQPVEFKFAYGSGRAVGMRYSTREGVARLEREVEFTLSAAPQQGASNRAHGPNDSAPMKLTGSALEYTRDSRLMRVLGPVTAVQGGREMRAGALAAEFDAEMFVQAVVASGRPNLRELAAGSETTLAAEQIAAAFRGRNVVQQVIADGQAVFTAKDAGGEERLSARRIEMDLDSAGRSPVQVRALRNVQAISQNARQGAQRRLETETLHLDFAPSPRAAERRLTRVTAPSSALLEFRQGEEQSRIRAAQMTAGFEGRNEIRRVTGGNGVEITRRLGRAAEQQTVSREFALTFDSRGDWAEAEQTGDVRFREGARTGQAQRALAVRRTEQITLSGGASLGDAVSRTSAPTIEISQRTGEIIARGGVRTSYSAARQSAGSAFVPSFASQPAHITAEELRANAEQGRAIYSGNARLWQGAAVIEGAAIELRRGTGDVRELHAMGQVRAVIPQVAGRGTPASLTPAQAQNPAASPTMWKASAEQLHYRSSDSVIRLEEKVRAESSVGQMQAQRLELYLQDEQGKGQQLAKALATGGVSIQQGDRRGTAERAEYTASEGKFVLSGGKPTLYDAVLGTTTGRQLTFFLADDRILVDSEEGSRTVTRHRVGK